MIASGHRPGQSGGWPFTAATARGFQQRKPLGGAGAGARRSPRRAPRRRSGHCHRRLRRLKRHGPVWSPAAAPAGRHRYGPVVRRGGVNNVARAPRPVVTAGRQYGVNGGVGGGASITPRGQRRRHHRQHRDRRRRRNRRSRWCRQHQRHRGAGSYATNTTATGGNAGAPDANGGPVALVQPPPSPHPAAARSPTDATAGDGGAGVNGGKGGAGGTATVNSTTAGRNGHRPSATGGGRRHRNGVGFTGGAGGERHLNGLATNQDVTGAPEPITRGGQGVSRQATARGPVLRPDRGCRYGSSPVHTTRRPSGNLLRVAPERVVDVALEQVRRQHGLPRFGLHHR